MFENKKITIEKVKDLLYNVQQEVENELDYDYISIYKSELDNTDFNVMLEFLDNVVNKINLVIDNELVD